MSVEAINWVFKQSVRPSSVKFVLVALADNAGDTGECWPSLATICAKTCQDRKTVILALDKLTELGLISDTKKRMGATHQVKVYKLVMEGFQKRNSSKIPDKQFRFSHQTVPKTEPGTIREPSLNHQGGDPPGFRSRKRRKFPSEALKAIPILKDKIQHLKEYGIRGIDGKLIDSEASELRRLRETLAENENIACEA